MKLSILLVGFFILIFLASDSLSQVSSLEYLIKGKHSLNSGDFQRAEEYLTKSLKEFKEIGDYVLLWRANAYKKMNKYEDALKDINSIKRNYPKSPLIKEAKKEEIEIAKLLNLPNLEQLYQSFIIEYPDEIKEKFDYGIYLKQNKKFAEAKQIFREIFITPTQFADLAEKELSEKDITVNDLIRKAKTLNNAYQFKKAESYLTEALSKSNNSQKLEILSLLGYSLFMQKRYSEAADIFKKSGDYYWRARAVLRAKNYEVFEREFQDYINSKDDNISDVIITYANTIRRNGNFEKAIKILKIVLNKYPTAKEEALWALAWTYYLKQDYNEAEKILHELYSLYGKLKYLYWLEKVKEIRKPATLKQSSISFQHGNIYSYLLYTKGKISNIPEYSSQGNYQIIIPKRLEILIKAGFTQEAKSEIKSLLKQNKHVENIPSMCKILYDIGDYSTSVRLISKLPDKLSFPEILYPQAYKDIVIKASRKFNINPYLIFAVIREESRFDLLARSPAGALGLMQLMPETAKIEGKKIGITIKNNSEIFEPEKNIFIGSFYLRKLLDEFDNTVIAIAAYNAGEKAVSSWLKNNSYRDIDEFIEDIPYAETKVYVQRVLTSYFEYLRLNKALTKETILNIIKTKGGSL